MNLKTILVSFVLFFTASSNAQFYEKYASGRNIQFLPKKGVEDLYFNSGIFHERLFEVLEYTKSLLGKNINGNEIVNLNSTDDERLYFFLSSANLRNLLKESKILNSFENLDQCGEGRSYSRSVEMGDIEGLFNGDLTTNPFLYICIDLDSIYSSKTHFTNSYKIEKNILIRFFGNFLYRLWINYTKISIDMENIISEVLNQTYDDLKVEYINQISFPSRILHPQIFGADKDIQKQYYDILENNIEPEKKYNLKKMCKFISRTKIITIDELSLDFTRSTHEVGNTECRLSISKLSDKSINFEGHKYMRYSFSDNGIFQVSQMTQKRRVGLQPSQILKYYLILPKGYDLSISYNSDQNTISLYTPSGSIFIFSTISLELLFVTDFKIGSTLGNTLIGVPGSSPDLLEFPILHRSTFAPKHKGELENAVLFRSSEGKICPLSIDSVYNCDSVLLKKRNLCDPKGFITDPEGKLKLVKSIEDLSSQEKGPPGCKNMDLAGFENLKLNIVERTELEVSDSIRYDGVNYLNKIIQLKFLDYVGPKLKW